jgi:arsenate reductase
MRRYRVLFVCVGNSCRSQMAEGLARAYGSDVLEAESAGLSPCGVIFPPTREVMQEKNVSLEGAESKGIDPERLAQVDLIVNLSGYEFPYPTATPVRTWMVPDPFGHNLEIHRFIRDQIEARVQELVAELREKARLRQPI